MSAAERPSYRWVVLGASTAGQMSFSAFVLGLPSIAPAFRDTYDVSLGGMGAFLALVSLGLVSTLFAWGLATDRVGERVVMTTGLVGAATGLGLAAYAPSFAAVVAVLAGAAAFGASVNSSTGKAIMSWFDWEQRGFALAIRQAGMMIAAAAAAVTLPRLAAAEGLRAALLALAVTCLIGGCVSAIFIPAGRKVSAPRNPSLAETIRDGRLWRLSIGSSFVCVAQSAVAGFVVLFLHDARGLSPAVAALALAGSQILGAGVRVGTGLWSDRVNSRVVPLRQISLASTLALGLAAVLVGSPIAVLFPVLVVAGGISMGWNTVSFAAAAELGGAARSGTALGLQQTVVGLTGAATPFLFAVVVEGFSWRVAWFAAAMLPLAGWYVLRLMPERD